MSTSLQFYQDRIAIQYCLDAKSQRNLEPQSRNFWAYLLQQHAYPENYFWFTSEHASAGKDGHITQLGRKIDQILNYADSE